MFKIGFVYSALQTLQSWDRVPVWWGGGVCTVIIVSNPTAVKVELSCIEVVVGVLTIKKRMHILFQDQSQLH